MQPGTSEVASHAVMAEHELQLAVLKRHDVVDGGRDGGERLGQGLRDGVLGETGRVRAQAAREG